MRHLCHMCLQTTQPPVTAHAVLINKCVASIQDCFQVCLYVTEENLHMKPVCVHVCTCVHVCACVCMCVHVCVCGYCGCGIDDVITDALRLSQFRFVFCEWREICSISGNRPYCGLCDVHMMKTVLWVWMSWMLIDICCTFPRVFQSLCQTSVKSITDIANKLQTIDTSMRCTCVMCWCEMLMLWMWMSV